MTKQASPPVETFAEHVRAAATTSAAVGLPTQAEKAGKVHVLFFASRLGGGGAEMNLLRVMNHLDRRLFRVSLAVTRAAGSFESALAGDVSRHVLETGARDSSTVRMMRSVIPLRRLIREQRPDVICSMMEMANVVNVLACRGLRPRPKIVLGVQTPPSISLRHDRHLVNRLLLTLIPRLYPQADKVIALSHGVAASVVALAPGVRDRIAVIYNAGVEDSLLEKAREPLAPGERPEGVPVVVACGRLKALKGFDYLIEALAQVRQTIAAELWIVGEGEERGRLEKLAARLGLGDRVRFLGFQSNPFKYMAAADVFALSSHFEGFGNVIVEAMACGTPVVSSDCPYGPGEIISEGENGLLVPVASASGLAGAILRILTDRELKEKLSRNGLKRAQDFHAGTIAASYGDELRGMVGARAAAEAEQ
jgi:glycosyltransferase involved in cell wall biosynthesis